MTKTRHKTKKTTVLHRLRIVVFPHHTNKYRPHAIRWQGISLVLLFAFTLQFAYNSWQTGSVLGQKSDVTSEQLLTLTNAARADSDRPALTLNAKLSQAAHAKARDMFAQQYWAHTAPDGSTPWKWIEEAGYNYHVAGENLAKNFVSSHGVVTAWLDSPEHRKNLLDSRYENVGFAVVPGKLQGNDTMLVVALYGTPQLESTVAITDKPQVLAAQGSQSLAARVGTGLQSLNPSVLTTIVLCALLAIISLAAHLYRRQLPKEWQTNWKRHHGLYKAGAMVSLIIVVLAFYGGGQI